MLETVLATLEVMGWLGVILAILVTINIATSTILNVWSGQEKFSWKRFFKGFLKAFIFYISAAALSVAFAILPFINNMINEVFGVLLISNETLETLSSTGVLGTVMSAIVMQGKTAIESILNFKSISTKDAE